MRRHALSLVMIALMLMAGSARAETETDRLRDAVRTMTGQLRALEDQRTQAQAKLAQAEREKALAVQAAAKLRAQLKDAQNELQTAVEEFNKRLEARDEALEKWKTAYAEAAGVAQEKDALRARFEEEAGIFKARTKSCEAKNQQLLKVSGEVLAAYRKLTPLDAALIKEPMIGFARVDHQNRVQDLQDKILDQDVKTTPQLQDKADEAKGESAKSGGRAAQETNAPNAKPSGARKGTPKNSGSKGSSPTVSPQKSSSAQDSDAKDSDAQHSDAQGSAAQGAKTEEAKPQISGTLDPSQVDPRPAQSDARKQ